jgi:hypothetical protein
MGYGAAGGGASFPVDAADFDGVNDFLSRGDFTGAADSKTGILSFWIYPDTRLGDIFSATNGANGRFNVSMNDTFVTGAIDIWAVDSANQYLFDLACGALTAGAWNHILASWDLNAAASAQYFYLNGASSKDASSAVYLNSNVDYTLGTWTVCETSLASERPFKVDAGLAEFYFAPGQYLDFSVLANREKFRSATGKPVSLGATGATPTGTVPKVYLHLDNGEAAANFATNRSGNGNFTVTGTLTTHASSPSD